MLAVRSTRQDDTHIDDKGCHDIFCHNTCCRAGTRVTQSHGTVVVEAWHSWVAHGPSNDYSEKPAHTRCPSVMLPRSRLQTCSSSIMNTQHARAQLATEFLRGNTEMYRRSGLVISREQGLRYDAGFAVPVLMSGCDVCMGRSW